MNDYKFRNCGRFLLSLFSWPSLAAITGVHAICLHYVYKMYKQGIHNREIYILNTVCICTLYAIQFVHGKLPIDLIFYSSVVFSFFQIKRNEKFYLHESHQKKNLSLGLFLDTFITCFPFSIISCTYDINVLKIIMTIDAVCVRKKHICKQNIAIQTWLVCFVCANYETKLRHKNR